MFISSLPLIIWSFKNSSYPVTDAAEYTSSLMLFYRNFEAGNIVESFIQAYQQRIWKPILFPFYATPFAFIFQGDVKLTLFFYHFLIHAFSTLIIFKLFNKNSHFIKSIFFTLAITTHPMVNSLHFKYLAESSLLFSYLLCFYSYILFFDTGKIKPFAFFWFGVFIGIGARPLESFFILLIPSFLILKRSCRLNILTRWKVIVIVLPLIYLILRCTYFYLLFLKFGDEVNLFEKLNNEWAIIGIFLLYFLISLFSHSRYYQILTLFFLGGVFWYGPFLGDLINWIHECTFGKLALLTGHRHKGDFFDFIFSTLSSLNLGVILLFLFLYLIGTVRAKKLDRGFIFIFLSLGLFLAGALTENGDLRYYTPSISLTMTVFIFFLLQRKNKTPIFISIITLYLMLQSTLSFMRLFESDSPLIDNSFLSSSIVYPERDDHYFGHVIKKVLLHVQQQSKSKSKVLNLFIGVDRSEIKPGVLSFLDPWSLNLLSMEKKYPLSFHHAGGEFPNLSDFLNEAILSYDYILIGSLEDVPDKIWSKGQEFYGLELLKMKKNNSLPDFIRYIDTLDIENKGSFPKRHFMLLKIEKNVEPEIKSY